MKNETASLWSLAGKRALVTGASRGIGLAIARALGERGAEVWLMARDAGRLERRRPGWLATASRPGH